MFICVQYLQFILAHCQLHKKGCSQKYFVAVLDCKDTCREYTSQWRTGGPRAPSTKKKTFWNVQIEMSWIDATWFLGLVLLYIYIWNVRQLNVAQGTDKTEKRDSPWILRPESTTVQQWSSDLACTWSNSCQASNYLKTANTARQTTRRRRRGSWWRIVRECIFSSSSLCPPFRLGKQ